MSFILKYGLAIIDYIFDTIFHQYDMNKRAFAAFYLAIFYLSPPSQPLDPRRAGVRPAAAPHNGGIFQTNLGDPSGRSNELKFYR